MPITSPKILLLQPHQNDSQMVFDLVAHATREIYPQAIISTIHELQHVYRPEPQLIVDAISEADLIIGNMDGGNVSVTFGLGVAVSMSKPILLIAPAERAFSIPEDLFKNPVFVFSFSDPQLFIDGFKFKIKDALGNGSNATIETEKDVFISYCHADYKFLQRLMIHLRPLEKAGLINTWVDTHLRGGDDWLLEITGALKRARVAVLIVSADFMASEFIVENELPPLLAKAQADGTRIVPLIAKPCRFTRDRNLARFQAVNDPRHPLIALSEAEAEEIYDKAAMTIESSIQKRI